MRIGLFDSGIGGLTVLKAFLKYHPNNEYYYYGDTLNMPYGDKPIEELYKHAKDIIEYLKNKNVDIIVIACGTVSANLYDRLKKEVDIPIYSVVNGLLTYMDKEKFNKTLVLATSKTIESHIFKNNIKNEVIEVACPKLVPLIENNDIKGVDKVIDEYLPKEEYDSLVLGCTHYPIIREQIENRVNKNVKIIDMGEVLAQNISVTDSVHRVDLYFSKKTDKLEENVNKMLKRM